MSDKEPGQEGEAVDEPELCDVCGIAIKEKGERYASVRDSSASGQQDPLLDGRRFVVACSDDHLQQLIEDYKRRPFNDAELWAGRIARAERRHSGEMNADQLAEETGLTPEQIERGISWQTTRFMRWHEQFGEPDSDPEEDE
ncbi:hypothetical protein [Streptomyces lavendofoliae]|uniref:hypothetical protein n=1 Tax=Streptomyces lavendofoliae TaxID=67314 RepID=UPI003D937BDC